MKQLLQYVKDGRTAIEEIPTPTPKEGQALVKVGASLVSAGTERMVVEFAEKSLLGKAQSRPDLVKQVLEKAKREGLIPTLQAAFNRLDEPMALGYSSAGTIVALGADMQGFQVGQRVACAGGGYASHAEYNVVPRNLLTPIPDSVDFEAAAFTTLGAIALHGLRLGEPQLGENVAVIGLGLLGLLVIQMASAAGCQVLGIDLDPARIDLARSLGVKAVHRSEAEIAAQAFCANRGFDLIIICADTASNDPVELAGVIARDRAKVVATGAVGLSFPRKVYYEKEISFINSRSYGPGRYDLNYEELGNDYPIGYIRWTEGRNFQAVVALLESGKLKVKPLITHRFDIEHGEQAYQVITGKQKEAFLGVILTYGEEKQYLSAVQLHPQSHASAPCKLGVCGAGLYANATLLPILKNNNDFELVGIASSGGLHAKHAGQKFGFQYATSSEDALIEDEKINTIAILTRHNTHASLVIKALKSGKHVFVEKPLAMNAKELQDILAVLAGRDEKDAVPAGILTVGFNRRFSPHGMALRELVNRRKEALFAHYRVNAGYIPPAHWVQKTAIGGGRIIGEACHFIDLLTYLVGSPPVKVNATALPNHGKYCDDNLSMTFTFPDGSVGVVDYLANGDKSFAKERLEVFWEGKIAILDDYVALTTIQNGKKRTTSGRQDKGWKNELTAFARAIQKGEAPPISYTDLAGVTMSSLAVIESLRLSEPVTIKDLHKTE